MNNISFKNAYYIKLGRNGKWEKSSIKENRLRIGWGKQTLKDINNGNWSAIKKQLQREVADKGTATRDCNALKIICESTDNDIWITFHASHIWWCTAGKKHIYKDSVSKYRNVAGRWRNHDINGQPLLTNQIPGTLSKLQGFRGTICKVKETDDLYRLINNLQSSEYVAILHSKENLVRHVENGIHRIHWKDFETLTDLLFTQSGWRRISTIGETMKYVDMELEDPITGDLYQVQVKSKAGLSDLKKYAKEFKTGKYRKFYFVVHSPDARLSQYNLPEESNVEILFPRRIAEMVVDLGLLNWLMKKIQ